MKKGFTLVEIMIVVAIIGIIIAIAVPAFLRARENARGRACQENLSKIDGAKEQYALEEKVANDVEPTWDGLIKTDGTGYLKTTPFCPSTSTEYTIGTMGEAPTCPYADDAEADFAQHTIDGKAPAATTP